MHFLTTFILLLWAILSETFRLNSPRRPSILSMSDTSDDMEPGVRLERSPIPSRNDICRMFVTGVVGTEPKETFLANGHYVLNFAVATVGHYSPVHEWEKFKPTETMWLSAEIWDDDAKAALEDGILRKGAKIGGMGTMIFNKWTDKATGEERKMFKFRMQKLMERDELEELLGLTGEDSPKSDASRKSNAKTMLDPYQEIEQQVPKSSSSAQSRGTVSTAVPSNVWPKPKPTTTQKKNSNPDFDSDQDDNGRDPRIPF